MKRKFLLLTVALLCSTVSWGYTSVVPQVGRSYYLYNIGTGQYWKGTSTSYSVDVLANATPITVESGYKLAFVDGSTTYRIYQDAGTAKPNNQSGVNFTLQGDASGYRLESKNTTGWGEDYTRDMQAGGSFPRVSNHENNVTWQFIACEEAMAYMSTFCAGVAEANYVQSAKGWQRVTSVSALQTNPEDYFFAIFSSNAPGILLDANTATNDEKLRYQAAVDPLTNSAYLFGMENYNSGFVLKSLITDKYFENRSTSNIRFASDGPWNYHADLLAKDENCEIAITLADGAYTINDKNGSPDNYLGLWSPANGYLSGQNLAGNKSSAEKGSFLIYRIAKKGLDMTSAIVNPSFETGNTTGWSYTGEGDHGAKDASNETYKMEGSVGNWLFNIWSNGHTISQTLPNMPAGIYKLTAVMGTDSGQEFRLTMGDATGTAASVEKGTGVTVETYYKLAAPGSLAISADAGGSQWYKVDNFRLTYMEPSLPGSLEEVTALMNITKKTTANTAISNYNTAISTYNSSSTSANLSAALTAYHAAEAAIAEAESSAEAYASVSSDDRTAYRTKMAEVLEQTNVYTADAYNKWYAEVESNYSAGVYTDAEVVMLNAAGAYSDGWHSASCIDDVLLSNWTIGGSQCHDFDTAFYINTWSTEGNDDGSNFKTPFFEYWTSDANSLDATTLVGTVSGLLPSSTYTLSIWCRVRQADGKTKVANSITLQVGSGSVVDLTSGTQVGSDQFYLDYFTATGSTNASGELTITINVAANSNISWLSFQKVQVKANVTVSAKAGKYGTVIFPFTPDVSEGFGDITFYNCASTSGATLVLTEETTPVADKPYIIKNDGVSNFSTTLSGMVTPSATTYTTSYTAGYLTGVYTAATIAASDGSNSRYVLQTDEGGVQAFYKVTSSFTATPYKCYLTVPAALGVKAFSLDIENAISDVRSKMEDVRIEIFNLAGQRLSKAQRGINIINGKKVLVK